MRMMIGAAIGLLLAIGAMRSARAEELRLRPGQDVALAIDGAVAAGGVVALVGSAVGLARERPARGWVVAALVAGTMNTLISPLMFVYGTDSSTTFGVSVAIVHGLIGVTDLVLAIAGGLMRERLLARERAGTTKVALVPIAGRDAGGGPGLVVGLGLRVFDF